MFELTLTPRENVPVLKIEITDVKISHLMTLTYPLAAATCKAVAPVLACWISPKRRSLIHLESDAEGLGLQKGPYLHTFELLLR